MDINTIRCLNGVNSGQNNLTNFPIDLDNDSKDCIGQSGGDITDRGSGYLFNINWLEFSGDTKSPADTLGKDVKPIKLYPNLASEVIYLENGAKTIVEIYDSLGKKILITIIQNTKEPIEISKLIKGVYFVKINKDGNIIYRQIIKK